ncbi:MAG: response regulator [Nanoarchaeota archaeon]
MSADKQLEALIVEDDPQMQIILISRLADFGVTANTASNMLDALALARLKKYTLYMTDGRYPLKPGGAPEVACFKFYEELKKIRPDAKVLLITGGSDFERDAMAAGMDFLLKSDFVKQYRAVFSRYFGAPR